MYILPYKVASKSAKKLAHEMSAVLLGDMLTLAKGDPSIRVINWGKGSLDPEDHNVAKCVLINKPDNVLKAVNKYITLLLLKGNGVNVPEFTDARSLAASWGYNGQKVVCRKKLEGKDGEGIIIVPPNSSLPEAKLYSKFIPAKDEFRVSVCRKPNGEYTAFAVQKKVPIKEGATPDVKTTAGGYGLSLLEEASIPKGVRPEARKAVEALGLDFGGVDVILGKDGKPYILEVNTAPELTDILVKRYAKHLKELVG